MNQEDLLALKNAEYNNEQRRLLRNQRSQNQRAVNLADGLVPYIFSNEKLENPFLSNQELSSSSDPLHVSDCDYDIDFGLISEDDCIENNETDDFEDDRIELNDNMIVLNELFSSKVEQDFLPLHPYTSISINEFCINLIRTFRRAN